MAVLFATKRETRLAFIPPGSGEKAHDHRDSGEMEDIDGRCGMMDGNVVSWIPP